MGMVFQKKYKDRRTGEIKTCRTWTIRYYNHAGKQCEESGAKTERAAQKLLRKRETDKDQGLPVGPEYGRITFRKAVDDVYDDYTTRGRRTLEDVKRRVRLHLDAFFGDRWLVNITTADVRAYTADRRKEGAALATIRLELSILKRAFRLAYQANRVPRIPFIPMPTVDNARAGFFESDQVQALLAHLPAEVQPIIRFAFVTGWRIKSEVLPLQWRQVDLAAGEVRLEPGTTKNRKGRTFVLTPALKTLLEDQQKVQKGFKAKGTLKPWVFPNAEGDRFNDLPREAWERACKRAGCPGRIPHDLRRTAVRNLVRAGVSENVAMQMCGHRTRSVFDRYDIVSPGDLREAANKLATAIDTVIVAKPEAAKSSNATQGESTETLRKTANSARSSYR